MIADNNNIAYEFNKYLTSIENQLANKIKSNTLYKAYLKNYNQNSFFPVHPFEYFIGRNILNFTS